MKFPDRLTKTLDKIPALDRVRIRTLSQLEGFARRQLKQGKALSVTSLLDYKFSEENQTEHACRRLDWMVYSKVNLGKRVIKVEESQHYRRNERGFLDAFLRRDGEKLALIMGNHPTQLQAEAEIWPQTEAKLAGMMTRLENEAPQEGLLTGTITNSSRRQIYTV
jgi:hypothetical protein